MSGAPRAVLHVVQNLDRGAVENWLVRMLKHARRRQIDLDWSFYCTLGRSGAMDETVQALGARAIHSPVPIGRKFQFTAALRSELQRGSYDVLHCHHDLVSAVYLLASAGLPIRRRVVHAHNADESVLTPNILKQRLYREPVRRICLMADRVVGISHHTLDTFLAGRKRRAGRDVVHYYGVDPSPFETVDADPASFRRELDLANDALILLFAGRLVPEKNPVFAVDVLASLRNAEPRAVAVFAGSGSLEQAVLARARELGVEASIRLLGWRSDLPKVMSCCDWFILPRPEKPMEGLGLAVIEAQLAGLRLLLSKGIPNDSLLSTTCAARLPLAAGAAGWARSATDLLSKSAPNRYAAIAALARSPFDMDFALRDLLALYR